MPGSDDAPNAPGGSDRGPAERDESPDDRLAALLSELTVAEKIGLTHGTRPADPERVGPVAGYLAPVERLDVGELRLADGPLGVRVGTATAFPASIALGGSFDPGLAETFGAALGREARAKGVDVLLAPGCNLVRVPQCGRTFEYFGEDPVHAAGLTPAVVRGIQSQGVVATPKHYVANNQERERTTVSAAVDERTLRELYLPAFEAAVRDGDAGAVMAAYNRVNGTYATEHERLLDVLKSDFGFDGPVLSDWWAVQDGLAAARAGLDLEMPGIELVHLVAMALGLSTLHRVQELWPSRLPGPEAALGVLLADYADDGGMPESTGSLFARTLPGAVADGSLPTARLDDMVRRVLRLHDRVGALDGHRESVTVDPRAHRDLAKRIATRGTVLLEHDDTLPLSADTTVAVVGPNADEATVGGGGSSEVEPRRTVSPVDGIRGRSEGSVSFVRGHPRIQPHTMFEVDLPGGGGDDAGVDVAAVQSTVASADVAVVVVQDNAAEGRDRDSLALPGQQDRLVSAVAAAADRTVVVLQTAGPVEMPWLDAVESVLAAWYPGQEAGRAIAAVLYGDADPGGRLPVTFGTAGDYPATATASYPGVVGVDGTPRASYDEGVFVGYRHFDRQETTPVFPFGHGLSYATVDYGDPTLAADETAVSVPVENTSDRAGREVVQVYVRPPDAGPPRPPRELAGFTSVGLDAGEQRTVAVTLAERACAVYDEQAGEWTVPAGEYTLEVGRSSRDCRGTVTLDRPE